MLFFYHNIVLDQTIMPTQSMNYILITCRNKYLDEWINVPKRSHLQEQHICNGFGWFDGTMLIFRLNVWGLEEQRSGLCCLNFQLHKIFTNVGWIWSHRKEKKKHTRACRKNVNLYVEICTDINLYIYTPMFWMWSHRKNKHKCVDWYLHIYNNGCKLVIQNLQHCNFTNVLSRITKWQICVQHFLW